MYNSELSIILAELQIVTGEVTNDIDYLIAKLLLGGTESKSEKAASKYIEEEVLFEPSEMDLDKWFDSMEDVECGQ